tara:strand:+ start:1557 stop:1979 length:423 start_codon:yes stop_codon:yes gene_type:complete
MATWHIFYTDSTKLITWSTNGMVDDSIITEQANTGLLYLSKDTETIPSDNDFWVNNDGDDIIEKSIFEPTFSTLTPALDAVVNVTGVPTGTQVWLDEVSAGTMSDTTLTLTATEPGKFTIKFTKIGHKDYSIKIQVGRLA